MTNPEFPFERTNRKIDNSCLRTGHGMYIIHELFYEFAEFLVNLPTTISSQKILLIDTDLY